MNNILLCSHDPLFVKNLYGILRDEGFTVEIADHPALAVRMFLGRQYASIIFDSEPFGLSAEEALQIIRSMTPDMPVIMAGNSTGTVDALTVKVPIDLEEFRQIIQSMHLGNEISTH